MTERGELYDTAVIVPPTNGTQYIDGRDAGRALVDAVAVSHDAAPLLPATVQIGPYTYTIITIDRLDDDAWADIRWQNREIRLKNGLQPDFRRTALLHEILHGVNDIAGLTGSKHREESFTICQSPLLLDTLRRNPALVAFLLDGAR